MTALGELLASALRAGDLIVLGGDLGAGKTTLAQGIGAGMGVRGPIISPTFVIARVHPSVVDGPPLVHVDAYRLSGWDELEDLDLEATLDQAVTLVEWGEGVAEGLAGDRLDIHIERARGDGSTYADMRRVWIHAVGLRWDEDELNGVFGSQVT